MNLGGYDFGYKIMILVIKLWFWLWNYDFGYEIMILVMKLGRYEIRIKEYIR